MSILKQVLGVDVAQNNFIPLSIINQGNFISNQIK